MTEELVIESFGVRLSLSQRVLNDNYKLVIFDYDSKSAIELKPEQLKQIEQFIKEQNIK